MSKPIAHTFTVQVTVRNLMADMCGDEQNNRLPPFFAMRASLLALRADYEGLLNLHNELSLAGWSHFTAGDMAGAETFKNACTYCMALHNATI